jgi:hypothetical protein
MATTLKQIKKFLKASGLRYEAFEEDDVITVGFRCDPEETTFRDGDGNACLGVLLRLVERGKFLIVITPTCWNVRDCPHRQAVCEALTLISGRFKMIRFDLDKDSGEIRPNIELPIEDGELTPLQLQRAIGGILQVVRQYDRVITRARDTGEISFEDVESRDDHAEPVAEEPSPPSRGDIAKLLDLAGQAGGLDAIERLLGGGDAPPVQT